MQFFIFCNVTFFAICLNLQKKDTYIFVRVHLTKAGRVISNAGQDLTHKWQPLK